MKWLQLMTTYTWVNQGVEKCSVAPYMDQNVLQAVQLQQILPDGKEFVDRATNKPCYEVEIAFKKLGKAPSRKDLRHFIEDNFHPAGHELEAVTLPDFNPFPDFLKGIRDPILRGYSNQIHLKWNQLIRQFNASKLCDGCESSLIETHYPFIVPGGRFREFYYWDTFFSLEGLLVGDLTELTKYTLYNFLHLIDEYGFMPNGARKYYLNRSQPPMLVTMIQKYLKATENDGEEDLEFLTTALPTLEREYHYWMTKHKIEIPCPAGEVEPCFLNRYYVNSTTPRPESYREDYDLVEKDYFTTEQKNELYSELNTGAETGWDFSSRWVPQLTNNPEDILEHLKPSEILPVDLNSILYRNEITMAKFYLKLAHHHPQKYQERAQFFNDAAERRVNLMEKLMWNTTSNSFYDVYIPDMSHIVRFSPSNYWPYWANALTPNLKSDLTKLVQPFVDLKERLKKYPGGIPTSEYDSGLQWDFPNMWPPLIYIIVEATQTHFDLTNFPHVSELGLEIAQNYVTTTFCAWYRSGGSVENHLPRYRYAPEHSNGAFFEKYNVTRVGGSGGGGEYNVQTGFGWTNGVLLHLMNQFPKQLSIDIAQCQLE